MTLTYRLGQRLPRLRLGPEEHVELLGDGRVLAERGAEARRRRRVHRAPDGGRFALHRRGLARAAQGGRRVAARRASEGCRSRKNNFNLRGASRLHITF